MYIYNIYVLKIFQYKIWLYIGNAFIILNMGWLMLLL